MKPRARPLAVRLPASGQPSVPASPLGQRSPRSAAVWRRSALCHRGSRAVGAPFHQPPACPAGLSSLSFVSRPAPFRNGRRKVATASPLAWGSPLEIRSTQEGGPATASPLVSGGPLGGRCPGRRNATDAQARSRAPGLLVAWRVDGSRRWGRPAGQAPRSASALPGQPGRPARRAARRLRVPTVRSVRRQRARPQRARATPLTPAARPGGCLCHAPLLSSPAISR